MEAAYTAAYADLYREHWWWRVRERVLLRKVSRILAGHSPARILDVGCGAGLFFDRLEAFGHVEGVESDRLAVEQSGRWRDRIHLGELATFESGGDYDLLLMLDVLEHLRNPEDVVRQGIRLLAPGGTMLVTVPAFDWLWTRHDDLNHHIKRYTTGQMRRLLSQPGLEVVETQYLFQSLVLPKLLVRAVETFSSTDAAVPRVPQRAINLTLQAWFRSENAIAGWLPFGTSVLVIARRCDATRRESGR